MPDEPDDPGRPIPDPDSQDRGGAPDDRTESLTDRLLGPRDRCAHSADDTVIEGAIVVPAGEPTADVASPIEGVESGSGGSLDGWEPVDAIPSTAASGTGERAAAPEPFAEPEPEPIADAEIEVESEPITEPTEQSEPIADAEPEIEVESEPITEPAEQSEPIAETQVGAGPDVAPGTEAAPPLEPEVDSSPFAAGQVDSGTTSAEASDLASAPPTAAGVAPARSVGSAAEVALATAANAPGTATGTATGGEPVEPHAQLTPMTPAELTASVGTGTVPAVAARRRWARTSAFNWRLALIRALCAGLAVLITVTVVPGLGFTGWFRGAFLLVAVIFGVLNAVVKPVLQFLVLRFLLSTYGVVVIGINAVLLWLLAELIPDLIVISSLIALLAGGLGIGLIGTVLETLLGATPPVIDKRTSTKKAAA